MMKLDKEMIGLGVAIVVIIGVGIHSLPPLPSKPPPASPKATSVPFSLLAETKPDEDGAPVYPADLLAIDGKTVSITGFIAPFNDPQSLRELILTKSGGAMGGCFFCAPPTIAEVVYIKRKGQENVAIGDAASFEGELHLKKGRFTEERGQFLYTVENARLVSSTD